jgi:hypothetical protein
MATSFSWLFTYAAIPFLVCALCGGLRRTLLAGKRDTNISPVTAIFFSARHASHSNHSRL